MPNPIRYADADGLQIAYQSWGDGDDALIYVPGLISHIELNLEVPEYVTWMNRLSARMRVIVYDKRGQGLSDRAAQVPGPEQRMDDITAIARAENLDAFALFGTSEGAATALLYAASFPERVRKVCVFGAFGRFANCDDYSLMYSEAEIRETVRYWGKGSSGYSFMPDHMPERRDLMARYERACCTPNAYRAMLETNFQIDIRSVLPQVKVPTLVMHRRDDRAVPVGNGRYLADHLPNANYIEYASGGHMPFFGDNAVVTADMLDFLLGGETRPQVPDSVLATVLFTDIVGSSERLAAMGDKRWRDVLDSHDRRAGALVETFRGRFVKSTGDGMLAIFDGPARAARCAIELRQALGQIGLEIRAGLHIGEVQPRGDDVAGMAVHVAARVADLAASGEVLITATLRDLIAGSGLTTAPRGEQALKGLPGAWMLHRLE